MDTPMGDAPAFVVVVGDKADDDAHTLVLADDEARVLALYDQLKTIQLEQALLRARAAHNTTDTEKEIAPAQQRLLDARAAYVLRAHVVDAVLAVHPVLRAVHQATHASPIERDLLPAVQQRDAVSLAVAREGAARKATTNEHAAVVASLRQAEASNAALAAEVLRLAAEQSGNDDGDGDGDSSDDATELETLQTALKESRQRWKLIKGAASAIVAGSGVDWARDAALRDMVLDPE